MNKDTKLPISELVKINGITTPRKSNNMKKSKSRVRIRKKIKRKRKKKRGSEKLTETQKQEKEAIKDLLENGLEIEIEPNNNLMNTLYPQNNNRMIWLGVTKSERKRQEKKIKQKKKLKSKKNLQNISNHKEFSDSPEKLKISKIDDSGGWKGGFEMKKIHKRHAIDLKRSRTKTMIRMKKEKLKRIGSGANIPHREKFNSLMIKKSLNPGFGKENKISNSISRTSGIYTSKTKKKFLFKAIKNSQESQDKQPQSQNVNISIWNKKRKKEIKNEMKEYRRVGGYSQNWDNRKNLKAWRGSKYQADRKLNRSNNNYYVKDGLTKSFKDKPNDFLTRDMMMKTFDMRMNGFEIHHSFKAEMEELKKRRKMYRVKNAFITDEDKLFQFGKVGEGAGLKKKIENLKKKKISKEKKTGFTLKDLFSMPGKLEEDIKPPVKRKERRKPQNYFFNPTLNVKTQRKNQKEGNFTVKKMKEELENLGVFSDEIPKIGRSKSKPVFKKKRSNTLKMNPGKRLQTVSNKIRPLSSVIYDKTKHNFKIVKNDKILGSKEKVDSIKKRYDLIDQILAGKRRNDSIKKYFERQFGMKGTNKRLMGLLKRKEVSLETKREAIEKNSSRRYGNLKGYEVGIILEECN